MDNFRPTASLYFEVCSETVLCPCCDEITAWLHINVLGLILSLGWNKTKNYPIFGLGLSGLERNR